MTPNKNRLWDYFLVPVSDPAQNEYVPKRWRYVEFLSGFTGSAGVLIFGESSGGLVTDSRYWEQAKKELTENFEVIYPRPNYISAIVSFLVSKGVKRVGLDFRLFSNDTCVRLLEELSAVGIKVENQKVDIVFDWKARPSVPNRKDNPIVKLKNPGLETSKKIELVKDAIQKVGERLKEEVVGYITTAWDEIAWITNLRSNEIDFNPLFDSRLIVHKDRVELFVDVSRLTEEAYRYLQENHVEVSDIDAFTEALEKPYHSYGYTPEKMSYEITNSLMGEVLRMPSPIELIKSQKSVNELAGIRETMISDGVAIVESLAQIEEMLERGKEVSELTVVEVLHENRKKQPGFITESFGTISAFGPNASQPHYAPSKKNNSILKNGNVILLDSGGHYEKGTTDVTRMIPVGDVPNVIKKDITLVTKAMLRLLYSKFPRGKTGKEVDVICRSVLWQAGYDFGHGTGHGVGYVLNVHEGPISISPRADVKLMPGNVISNEPGLYREGRWGVRVENLMVVRESIQNEFTSLLEFEPLTMVPIDLRLINLDELGEEREHLIDYNEMVSSKLRDRLTERARNYLGKIIQH